VDQLGVSEPKLPRQVHAPRRLQESDIHVHESPKQYFLSKYYEVIDMASGRLTERLLNMDLQVLQAIEQLLRDGWQGKRSDQDVVEFVANHYQGDLDAYRLAAQLTSLVFLHQPEEAQAHKIQDIIQAVASSSVKTMMPQVMKLLSLYLVCPATTATAERTFSELRRLKTYLRSTMGQRRLNSLTILSTYRDEVDKLDLDKLLREFVCGNEMR